MYKLLYKWITLFFLLILLPAISTAAPIHAPFQAGKDYQILSSPSPANVLPKNKVQVIEFFNYRCSGCYHFEPVLEKWLASKPNYIDFIRVPVIFEKNGDNFVTVYYIETKLGVENKMTPAIFYALHVQERDLDNMDVLKHFFLVKGISEQAFTQILNSKEYINNQLDFSKKLTKDYSIYKVPTLIINGKYKLDSSMVGYDNQNLITVLNYLVQKDRK
jgi:thiol:disulfide interchange protein DsbA